jgi:hypothetical protein
MKNTLSTTILTILVAFASADRAMAEAPAAKPGDGTTKAVAAKDAPVIEQAIPVVALLRSVKESDTALFQQCWDKPMAESLGLTPESAKRMIEEYRLGFDKVFGEYSLDEFSFSFVGGADVGAVILKFKDKKLPPLRVIKSGNHWKLGER